jgi:hypothetical protein
MDEKELAELLRAIFDRLLEDNDAKRRLREEWSDEVVIEWAKARFSN